MFLLGITENLNLIYAFDISDGVTTKKLTELKQLARASLESYNIAANATKVSIVTFANQPEDIWSFKDDQNVKAIQSAIFDINKIAGDADFNKLVTHVKSNILNDISNKEKNILLLYTQGSSINRNQLDRLKKKLPNVETIVVSIGDPHDIFNGFDVKIIADDEDKLPDALDKLEKSIGKLACKYISCYYGASSEQCTVKFCQCAERSNPYI